MNRYECVDCGLEYQAEKPDSPADEDILCLACWESDSDRLYEAPMAEDDFEPDLIGSQWYHEDLP